jgi:hypothetical protein
MNSRVPRTDVNQDEYHPQYAGSFHDHLIFAEKKENTISASFW